MPCGKYAFCTMYWFHWMLSSWCWFLVREPLQDSQCIKSRYGIGFRTIDRHLVKLLKAWHSKDLKCKSTFLARWAILASFSPFGSDKQKQAPGFPRSRLRLTRESLPWQKSSKLALMPSYPSPSSQSNSLQESKNWWDNIHQTEQRLEGVELGNCH